MTEYHKITTAWARDPETKHRTLIEGEWASPEFGLLADCDWIWTEKVDGTNIRIALDETGYRIGGRTDRAQIPTFLLERLDELAKPLVGELPPMILYGEGYGARIQKGGGNYIPDGVDFVLFDVRCGDLWLERENVEEIAARHGINVVPIVGAGSLHDAIDHARGGFDSAWGSFSAEGLIMRPRIELNDRRGRRVITKIKTKDFAHIAQEQAA